jgi:hypothetical protein
VDEAGRGGEADREGCKGDREPQSQAPPGPRPVGHISRHPSAGFLRGVHNRFGLTHGVSCSFRGSASGQPVAMDVPLAGLSFSL